MARSDVARLQRQLRRYTYPLCSSQLNSQQQPVATVECRTKQGCDVKLQAEGLQCVRVDNVDQLTDVYIDMAAAAELRGVERIYLVSELVRAERLCVTVRDSCGADTTQLWRGSDVMVAFVCKKFRLTSHGLIDRPLSTPVGFKHRSYFQRAVSHEDCVATSPVEPHVCDQHAPHPDNNRYVMLYARPISQYNDAATDERRVDESPLAEQITANSRVPTVPEIVVDTPRRQCSTAQNVTNYDANTCAIFTRTDCIDFATLEDVDSEG